MSLEVVESKYVKGQPWVGATTFMFQTQREFAYNEPRTSEQQWGLLLALNPFTNKVKWYSKEKYLTTSGVLVTSKNLVFYNAGDRWFKAVDAESGKPIWGFQAGAPIIGNPFSYGYKGKQFIGVMSGLGGIINTSFWGDSIQVACSPGGYDNRIEKGFNREFGLTHMCDFNLVPTTLSKAGGLLHVFSL